MRSTILGLTTAALAVGTLSLGLTGPAAQAAGGIDSGNISFTGALPSEVDVIATTPGDAVAAWVRPVPGGERIYASHGTDGGWSAPLNVTHSVATAIEDLHVVGNDKGDVAAVWTQTINGNERVRAARYLGGGQWDGPVTVSSPSTTGINETAATMDGAGRVHVVVAAEVEATDPLHAAAWAPGALPVLSTVSDLGRYPSLDASPAGRVVVAFKGYHQGLTTSDVSVRSATSGWSAPDTAPWPGETFSPRAAVAEDGAATVTYLAEDGDDVRVVGAKVSPAGVVGNPDIVSAPDTAPSELALTVTAGGTAIATWSQFNGSQYSLHTAARPATGSFSSPTIVASNTGEVPASLPFGSDTGRRVVVFDTGADLAVRYRTSPVQPFATYNAGTSEGEFAADTDAHGNVVAVSILDNGGSSFVQADWLDLVGPTSGPAAFKAQTLATTIPVGWTATDSLSPVASTDVIVRTAAWNQASFGEATVVGNNLTDGPFAFAAQLGRTYCFETQAIDALGNLGHRSALRCTTVPLDDKQLSGSGWNRSTKAGHFRSTTTSTITKGRQLTRTGITARRLALVAAKVPNGGTVKVFWNGSAVRTISLKGTAAKKVVLPIVTFPGQRTGKLAIKVVSKGKPVLIDGLVVAK